MDKDPRLTALCNALYKIVEADLKRSCHNNIGGAKKAMCDAIRELKPFVTLNSDEDVTQPRRKNHWAEFQNRKATGNYKPRFEDADGNPQQQPDRAVIDQQIDEELEFWKTRGNPQKLIKATAASRTLPHDDPPDLTDEEYKDFR